MGLLSTKSSKSAGKYPKEDELHSRNAVMRSSLASGKNAPPTRIKAAVGRKYPKIKVRKTHGRVPVK